MMESCTRLPLEDHVLQDLVLQAKDYAVTHGLVVRTVTQPDDCDNVMIAPITLLPSPVPDALYRQAHAVQNDLNLLMHKVAHHYDFLKESLAEVIKVDDFTRRLWEIYDTVTQEGLSQPYSLGLNRSDYMFDCGTPTATVINSGIMIDPKDLRLRMIETNTMASSFGGLSMQLNVYHRFILERMNLHGETNKVPVMDLDERSADILARGLLTAWECYNKDTDQSPVILFLVMEPERNVYDQRHLEYAIYNMNPKVKVIYRRLEDVRDRGILNSDKTLIIDDCEVAVVYQRCLYTPDHYTSQQDWDTRLMLERSRAIKCPSAGYHLAGTKKVQQILSKPGALQRVISDPEAISRILATFTGQYSLDLDEEGDNAVKMALESPHSYVLKPQREGGGNNTFGEDIKSKLLELGCSTERTAYILMDHIHPYPVQNYLIRSGQPVHLHNCVSELGIYGAFVGTIDEVILNKSGGCCLRTKTVGTNEGGVATGFSCLDSPYLV